MNPTEKTAEKIINYPEGSLYMKMQLNHKQIGKLFHCTCAYPFPTTILFDLDPNNSAVLFGMISKGLFSYVQENLIWKFIIWQVVSFNTLLTSQINVPFPFMSPSMLRNAHMHTKSSFINPEKVLILSLSHYLRIIFTFYLNVEYIGDQFHFSITYSM